MARFMRAKALGQKLPFVSSSASLAQTLKMDN